MVNELVIIMFTIAVPIIIGIAAVILTRVSDK